MCLRRLATWQKRKASVSSDNFCSLNNRFCFGGRKKSVELPNLQKYKAGNSSILISQAGLEKLSRVNSSQARER